MTDFHSQELEKLMAQKEKGNSLFREGKVSSAAEEYSKCIPLAVNHRDLLCTVLANRAACYLKMEKYQECVEDCSAALEIDGSHKKSYFRRAQARVHLDEMKLAFNDLSYLLHIESKNADAIALMRKVKAELEKEKLKDSEVNRILEAFESTNAKKEDCLRSLIGLCADDVSHAMEFYRKGGTRVVGGFVDKMLHESINKSSVDHTLTTLAMKVFAAAATHERFVNEAVNIGKNTDESPPKEEISVPLVEGVKIMWPGICCLLSHSHDGVSQTASSLALRILKCLPAGTEKPFDPKAYAEKQAAIEAERAKRIAERKSKQENSGDEPPRVEILEDNVEKKENNSEQGSHNKESSSNKPKTNDPPRAPIKEYELFLHRYPAVLALRGWLKAMSKVVQSSDSELKSLESFTMASDSFAAFFSDLEDYIGHEKIVDARMENIDDRKERIGKVRLCKQRSKCHAEWAVEEGAIDVLINQLDAENGVVRQRASACFGRMVSALDDDELLKEKLKNYLVGTEGPIESSAQLPPIDLCRIRAALEATLFLSRPELGKWALGEPGGVQQLLVLISTQDSRCQEITAEVLCLASASDGGGSLLAPIVSSGSLQTLMMSSNPNTRAAAAAAMTKLSLQAKALKEDSPETSQMLNVVLEVLKASSKGAQDASKSSKSDSKQKATELVSFSNVGDNFFSKISRDSETKGEGMRALTSTERAVEVLAAMVGQSFVKEELVHGSYRVAASIEHLLSLDLESRSTIAYGVAHILAAITVTNKELHAKALAEKDMSVEQYEQLAELQRVKTKDDDGNEIAEKKEEPDTDSEQLCRLRIKRIVSLNAIPSLVRLLSSESKQTKEYAARALRQICVEESVRGQMSQQGGLKACTLVATDENCDKNIRREAAHAVAKTLVTTNPTILSEHLRLGCIRPLIFLCKDVDATNLQQFEALLALTNLTSCGDVERDRFAAEKGVNAAHYLMFSDHLMVRRAATEVLCNLSTHEKLLNILRYPEKVRLWLGLCEDWDNEENDEAFATACAASGTLASAAADSGVAKALLEEKCAASVISLLESQRVELIHRCLVIVLELTESEDHGVQLATQMLEHGIVPLLSQVIKTCKHAEIVELAKNTAKILSDAMSKADKNKQSS